MKDYTSKKIKILDIIKSYKKELFNNLESFTIGDFDEYKEYIEEVLFIMKSLIPEKDQIYNNLYYINYFNSLLSGLTSINNEKIKGFKLNEIEISKKFFLQLCDSDYDAEDYANRVYWFTNVIKGFNFLVPETISTKSLELSIISIYYNYYLEEYNKLESNDKETISKDIYIHLKMLENRKLREILCKYELTILDESIFNVFKILVHYDKPISVVIGESANEELTIEIHKNLVVKYNEKEYFWNNSNDIKSLKKILGLDDNIINRIYNESISRNNYANKYIDYIIPICLKNDNIANGGNIFWFYKLYAQKYLKRKIINNNMLCEFNDAIEDLLKIYTYNSKNKDGIWNSELEDILNKGYQLIYSLEFLRNSLWDNNNDKKEIINQFIKRIMNVKKLSKLFISCETKTKIIETLIYLINMIRDYFNKYGIVIWSNLDLLINDFKSYLDSEKLKKRYEIKKIGYAKQLNKIKNELDNQCNANNKNKFIPLYKDIENLKDRLNEEDEEIIEEEIKDLEIRKNMYIKIVNEYIVETINKSKILSSHKYNYNYLNNFSEVLKKYSRLNDIIFEMKKTSTQKLFIKHMFNFCDISNLENFIDIYKDSLINQCQNNECVTDDLTTELKHLSNSLFIIDIINIFGNSEYKDYLDFIKKILNNNLNCIRNIGNYFGDNDYIYLPKFEIIDLKYCIRYGLEKKKRSKLIKIYDYDEKTINDPEDNGTIEDYFKYLISIVDKTIDRSQNIDTIINSINSKITSSKYKDTMNNLYNAFKIINLFKDIKYEYNFEWIIEANEKMKNKYWKEPGKIIVKKKFNSLINTKDGFNGEKLVAKYLYLTHEANIFNEFHCKSEDLKGLNDILSDILNDIYESPIKYDYGYKIVSFYDTKIYNDNVGETMVNLIYSIYKILESSILNTENSSRNQYNLYLEKQQMEDVMKIIKNIFYNFIIECIITESPDFDHSDLMQIINILIFVMLNEYNKKYKDKKNSMETDIKNKIDIYVNFVSEIKEKLSISLMEKHENYIKELQKYNDKINELRERYKRENSLKKFIKYLINRKYEYIRGYFEEDDYIYNEEDIPEKIKKKYENYIKKNIEEANLKNYYNYNKNKPFNYKYDKILVLIIEKCEALEKIKELPKSKWKI